MLNKLFNMSFLLLVLSLSSCTSEHSLQFYQMGVEFKESQKHLKYMGYGKNESASFIKENIEFSKYGHELIEGSGFGVVFYQDGNQFSGIDRGSFEKLTMVFKSGFRDKSGTIYIGDDVTVFYSRGSTSISSATMFGYPNIGQVTYEWLDKEKLALNISLKIRLIDLFTKEGVLGKDVIFERKLTLKKAAKK